MTQANNAVPLTAPASREQPAVSFTFDFSDDSDDENRSRGDDKVFFFSEKYYYIAYP